MKHFATLFFLTGFFLISNAQQNCTYTDAGSSQTYSLSNGQILCIESGVFTGTINALAIGAEIRVAPGAVFQPASLQNAAGLLTNKGTVKLQTGFLLGDNFSVINDSAALFQWLAPQSFAGIVSIVIHKDAEMDFFTPFELPAGSDLLNEGMMVSKNALTVASNALLSNEGVLYVWGDLTTGGILFNAGLMKVGGSTNISNGAFFNNKCSFYGNKTLTNDGVHTQNYGYLYMYGKEAGNGKFINNGQFLNAANAIVQATDFDNHAQVAGSGAFTIAMESRNYGSFGADGGGINFYDMTPSGNQVFDVQTIPPHQSVFASARIMYDTTYISENCDQIAFPDFINTPLPVVLNRFEVSAPDCIPHVMWQTIQERNSDYFELQRKSENENVFSTIATITAAGYSDEEHNYSFVDEPLKNGNYQYRLKVVDMDGRFTCSRVSNVQIMCGIADGGTVVYPNPAVDMVNVSLHANADDAYTLSVYDITGRRVISSSYDLNSGLQVISIPVAHLQQGYYTILLTNNIKTESYKFLKN